MPVSKLIWGSLPYLLQGAGITLQVWAGSAVGAMIVGLVLALCRMSGNKFLTAFARIYLSAFRGTPLLIQLMIFYYGLTSFKILLTPMQAAYIGFILHFGAYLSEIFRAAIAAVDKGQWEAAATLGMTTWQALRRIILPQAARIALPPTGNMLVDLIKGTSVASMIQVAELTERANEISAGALVVMPLLLAAAVIYWVMTTLLTLGLDWLEQSMTLPGTQRRLGR